MIPNFKTINLDQCQYRGGQPVTVDDWKALAGLGVRWVFKLNEDSGFQGSTDDAWLAYGELEKCEISIAGQILGPDLEELSSAVHFFEPNSFVHCWRGVDRTGLFVALWRVLRCGWSIEQAREEWGSYGGDDILLPGLIEAFDKLAPKFAAEYANKPQA
jgi:hypothetical protein